MIYGPGHRQIRVRVASLSNLSLSGTGTVDGVTVAAGDRVLAAGQTNPVNNGVYVVASGAWTRAPEMAAGSRVSDGTRVFVTAGNGYADSVFVATSDCVVGVDPLTFVYMLRAFPQQVSSSTYATPGMMVSGASTLVTATNSRFYYRLFFSHPARIDQLVCEVTSGATGNLRMGLALADNNWQPATVLADSGDISSATASVKVYTLPNPVVVSGFVLTMLHTSAGPTVRELTGALLTGPEIDTTVGGNPLVARRWRSMTYGAFDTTPWNATVAGVHERIGVFVRVASSTP